MKTTARKALCIVMAFIFVLSSNNATIAGATSNRPATSTTTDHWELETGWHHDHEPATTISAFPNEDENHPEDIIPLTTSMQAYPQWLSPAEWWEAFRASGTSLEEFNAFMPSNMTLEEMDAFLPPGITFEKARAIWFDHERSMYFNPELGLYFDPERSMWFCAILDAWVYPESIVYIGDMPYSDEAWPDDSGIQTLHENIFQTLWSDELQALWSDEFQALWGDWGDTIPTIIWACPDEEEYFMTHGRPRDLSHYLDLDEYEIFRESGLSLADFLAYEANRRANLGPVFGEDGGSTNIRDIPFVDANAAWLTDNEFQRVWACPDEEEYYLTHGRYLDLLDYMTLEEYEIFSASGMRLAEFLALRDSGISLTELTVKTAPHIMSESGYGYLGYYTGSFYFYDLPIIYDAEWLEDDAILSFYYAIMPLSTPTLTVHLHATRSDSITVTGVITNPAGATITHRGFWIRRDNQTQQREVLASATSNTFSSTITGLTPNSTYHVRAIARTAGMPMSVALQSPAITVRTLPSVTINTPGAPRNFTATPAVGQATLTWQAPTSNGGATITRYEASLNSGPWITSHSSTRHVFSGLTSGSHTFRVRAVNSAGGGMWASTSATIPTQGTPPTPTPPPQAGTPTLTISRGTTTSTSVNLTGTITNTGGASITSRGFIIRRAGFTDQEVPIATTLNPFSHTITGLLPNTTYHVSAFARNINGGVVRLGRSSEIMFTTPPNAVITVPAAPTSLNASQFADRVTITWVVPANANITRHEISRNNGPWITTEGHSWHRFDGLPNGTHTFRVRAVNSAGTGNFASITFVVGPPPVQVTAPTLTLSRGATTSTSVTLTGTITNTGGAPITARGFWIRRADQTQHQEIPVTTTSNTFTDTITGLLPGTTYHVRAFARNSGIIGSGLSSDIIFTTPNITVPGAPHSLSVTSGTGQVVTLSWSPPINNGGAPIIRYEVSANNGPWTAATALSSPLGAEHVNHAEQIEQVEIEQSDSSLIAPQSITMHTFTGLFGGMHTFRVRAVNSVGAGTPASLTTFTVVFNPNGGTLRPEQMQRPVASGDEVGLLPQPARSGHTFIGWFTAQTGGTQVHSDRRITSNEVFWARWSQDLVTITITFNANGGAPIPNPTRNITPNAMIGQTMTLPPGPRRQGPSLGHRFVGWFTHPTAGVPIATYIPRDRNVTAYARWTCNVALNETRIRYPWWSTNVIPLKSFELQWTVGSTWHNGVSQGMRSWNDSMAPITFTESPVSGNLVFLRESCNTIEQLLGTRTFGVFYPNSRERGEFTSFEITLCPRAIAAHADDNDIEISSVIASVMAHELGHVIGLRDGNQPWNGHPTILGDRVDASIMNGLSVTGPQDFDIESVRLIYD